MNMEKSEAWMAVTGTSGRAEGCDKPFWLKEDAVTYVRAHGGYVKPLFFLGSSMERSVIAMNVLSGWAANPAVFAANDQNGWELVNCTEQQLCDRAVRMADALRASLNQPNSMEIGFGAWDNPDGPTAA